MSRLFYSPLSSSPYTSAPQAGVTGGNATRRGEKRAEEASSGTKGTTNERRGWERILLLLVFTVFYELLEDKIRSLSRRQPSSRFLSAFHSLATLTHYAAQRSRPKGVGGRVASVGTGEGARRPKGEAAGRFRLGAKAAGRERRNGERREPGVASRVSHGSVPKASEGNRERVTAPRETRMLSFPPSSTPLLGPSVPLSRLPASGARRSVPPHDRSAGND